MVVIIDPLNAGIAGNMVLGALIDLGADMEGTKSVMEYFASSLGQVNINLEKLNKKGLAATQADIEAEDQNSVRYTELVKIMWGRPGVPGLRFLPRPVGRAAR